MDKIEKLVVVIEDFAVSPIIPNVLTLYGRHMPETGEATAYVRDSLLRQVHMFFEHPEHDITKIDTIRLYVDGADKAHFVGGMLTAGVWAFLFGENAELQKESIVREYHRLFTKLGELYDKIDGLQSENRRLEDRISGLVVDECEATINENKRLKNDINALKRKIHQLWHRQAALVNELDEMDEKYEDLVNANKKLKDENHVLKLQNRDLEEYNKRLGTAIDTRCKEIKDLKKHNETLIASVESLSIENAKLEYECKLLADKLLEYSKTNDRYLAENMRYAQEAAERECDLIELKEEKDTLTEKYDDLTEEYRKLKEEKEALVEFHETACAAYLDAYESLEKRANTYEAELKEKDKELKDLNTAYDYLENDLADMKEKFYDLSDCYRELMAERAKLQLEIEHIRTEVDNQKKGD